MQMLAHMDWMIRVWDLYNHFFFWAFLKYEMWNFGDYIDDLTKIFNQDSNEKNIK